MLPSLAQETLRFHYATTTSSRGTIEYSFDLTDPTGAVDVAGCSVQPSTTSEVSSQPRWQDALMMTAWVPEEGWQQVEAGGDTRRLVAEWRGRFFEVYGTAMPWVSPTGTLGHVQLYLRWYQG